MILSLLALGVALVVIGMEREALIYAWRTRTRPLPEGGGGGMVRGENPRRVNARPPETPSIPLSGNGYLATVDDEPPDLYDWTFDDWRTTVEEIRGL